MRHKITAAIVGCLRSAPKAVWTRAYGYHMFHRSIKRTLMSLQPNSSTAVCFSTDAKQENQLMQHLMTRIKMTGPITVADYMKEVLTNSLSGYYMHRDVFGVAGDFITSPEISQMFGEMIGVWIVNEWMNHQNNKEIQIVELGPGRGTLADDLLRVFSQFPTIKDKVSLHLVEVSPTLSRMQAAKLTGKDISEFSEDTNQDNVPTESDAQKAGQLGPYRECTSKFGTKVSWYRDIVDVPHGVSCFIAHEFLDALPIHKFHKTDKGWREVMVDVDPNGKALRFVLAPGQTPASVSYLHDVPDDDRTNLEICPSAGSVVKEMCQRITNHGGFSLIADYGHTGEKGGTFRAFKNHNLHDPLEEPGTADLTADVNFAYLKKMTSRGVNVFGPIAQARFLNNMGIGLRLQALLQQANQDHWSSLISGYKMLMTPEQMGERFKFMCLMGNVEHNYTPAGFVDIDFGSKTDGQTK